jgi:hypothetical protein
VIPSLDKQSLDRAKATAAVMITTLKPRTNNQRYFALLRFLETSMLANTALSLFATLNGVRKPPQATGCNFCMMPSLPFFTLPSWRFFVHPQ